jgi:ABC-type multidrug transport system permease subunit
MILTRRKRKMEQIETVVEFDIQDLLPIGITIGILGVALSYMASMQNDVATGFTAGSYARNISNYALSGSNKLASNIPLIVGAIVIAVVIGILLRYFVFGGMQR